MGSHLLSWRRALTIGASLLPGIVSATPLAAQERAPAKTALIVAIADYPPPAPDDQYFYGDLNSDNDVPLVEAALLSQGFDSTAIHVLRDARATRRGIVEAFRSLLIDPAVPGDIVFVHYSGHGHQITDDDGDEADGYDEVWVPYGAPADFRDGYAGELHLRDDELNDLLRELRAKLGPEGNVVVSIDACFSGSGTRAAYEGPVRGMPEPLGPPASTATRSAGDAAGGFDESGITGPPSGADDPAGLAPMVVFSAARHDEVSRETLDRDRDLLVGSLSLALAYAFVGAEPGMTYREAFARIKYHSPRTPR